MSSPSRRKTGCSSVRIITYKIASRAAVRPGVAFAGQPNALAIARSRLDAHFQRFGAAHRAFAVADGAGRNILARAVAARTRHVELHASAGLRDLSGAVALRAFSRRFDVTLPVAIRTNVVPGDVQPHHAAADRRPERNIDLIFEIGARLWSTSSAAAPRLRRRCRRRCP